MKRILNTLFISTQKVYLSKEDDTIVATLDNKVLLKLPLINISNVVCFGNIRVSPMLLGHCSNMGIGICFLTENGNFLARTSGRTTGNVLLRRTQYRFADNPQKCLDIAKNIVIAKIINSKTVLQRALRDHLEKVNYDNLKNSIIKLSINIETAKKTDNMETLRGVEGNSAQIYFSVFNELIVSQKDDFIFSKRSRRPPLDRVNSLLSFIYTLLYNDICSSLETVGLDPAVGYLHSDRPGRMSFALDMMEEFRPYFADRLVLSLINLKMVKPNDFEILDNNAVFIKENARKTILTVYQERKQDEIYHPFAKENMHLGLVFYTQALLMGRFMRGDIDGYPPFIWR